MELCPEGTLESLVELNAGLPEAHARRYTNQLLSGVMELHRHGVVHRDLKTANIFLTKDGNCLKLGDFGSAVQIQAHTTMPGELKGYVGTQGEEKIFQVYSVKRLIRVISQLTWHRKCSPKRVPKATVGRLIFGLWPVLLLKCAAER